MTVLIESTQEKVNNFLSRTMKMFINGSWVPSVSGNVYESINPANGKVVANEYEGGKEDVDRAVNTARVAFKGPWSKTSPADRSALLNKLADLIEQRGEELAYLETLEFGSTINMSRDAYVLGAAAHLRYYAGWATKIMGETIPLTTGGNLHAYTKREPVGVCGQITSWNFPLLGASWKLGAPLAAGNTVILKPSQQTALSTLLLGELIKEAGFPDGVVNIVTGSGRVVGEAITNHPDIDKIGFTGSTVVGKGIMRNSSDTLKKITLELGGKSPHIIFADADLDKAIQSAFMGIFTNSGQVCAAGSRLYIEKRIYKEVTEKLVAMAKNMKLGDPFDSATSMGPLVSKEQLERVKNYIEIAKHEGGKILTGGKEPRISELAAGYYLEPTIIANLDESCTAVKEEIFGPVLVVLPFEDIDEVIERANQSEYGLASGVFTRDISKAYKVINELEAGTVWVNQYMNSNDAIPLAGYKQSGMGAEMGYSGIEAYTKTKSVVINLD